MKRVTTENSFAEFRFADADGRERLCGWLAYASAADCDKG